MNSWDELEIQQREQLINKNIISADKKMNKCLESYFEDITVIILSLYLQCDNIADLYRQNKFKTSMRKVKSKLDGLNIDNKVILEKYINETYSEVSKILSKEYGVKEVNNKINLKWAPDKKTYKERLDIHKAQLISNLERGIINWEARQITADELRQEVRKVFNTYKNSVNRLINTEIKYAEIQATLDTYEAAGIKEYIYLSEKDERVCSICSALDNQIFKISDAVIGVNCPPLHTNGRCQIKAINY